jgi:hypothetical protein
MGTVVRVRDDEGEIEALRERIQEQEERIDDLELRYQAAMAKNDTLRQVVLGDLEAGEDAVREAPSLWMQVADLRTAMTDHGDRMDRLDSAGARGQPGAARKAKIRHALVKRATQRGTVSAAQAAQSESPALDYEDVLALFDYEIDETYASKLLDKAARDSAAFWIKKPSNPRDGRKTLRVDVTELDEDSPYLRESRKNAAAESANDDFAELRNNEHSEGGR